MIVHSYDRGLPGLVRESTLRSPQAVACRDVNRQLTYRELDLLSDAFAVAVEAATGGRRGAVVVRLARSVDVLVAFLGILKAGCWYLPVSLEEPGTRVASMVADARPLAVVADSADLCEALTGLPLVPLPGAPQHDALRPLRKVAPDDPVYVLFTSGSTGAPKGVLLGSAALCNRLVWMDRHYGLAEDDVVLQKTPCTFDVSGWELFWPLIAGAQCLFMPEGDHRDPALVMRFVRRYQVTTCHFVPSMLAVFLQSASGRDGASLRRVFCSGEALPAAVAVRFHQVFDAELHNLYGPTEAAIDVTYWPVPRTLEVGDRVLIGRPIDNCVLHVLDGERKPVAAGDVGELWIGGVPVAREYVNRPDATAAAFRRVGGATCYRTGDLVREVEGGLEYLGRADDQVKIRGVRVELGEVEQVLGGHPAVGHAVAVVVEGREPGESRLLAAVTARPAFADREPTESQLRSYLSERLPSAYVPSGVTWLDAIPLGHSGKADRRRLREVLGRHRAPSRMPGAADTSDLAGTWWDLVARPEGTEGDTEGFVSLGGHSLLAARLAGWCLEHLGVEVPLRLLLDENASLKELEAFVEAADAVPCAPSTAVRAQSDAPDRRSGSSPLAPGQRRLWLWSKLHPDSSAYHVLSVLRLRGEVSVTALQAALAAVVDRHDALRARVVGSEEPSWRYDVSAAPTLVERTAVQALTDRSIERFTDELVRDPIALDRAPLLRAGLFRSLAGGESCFVLSLHHVIADQRTTEIVLADLATAYAAALRGVRPVFEPAPSHAGHAEREACEVGSPRWQADLDHWRERLSEAPRELRLPFQRPSEGPPDTAGEAHRRSLGADRSQKMRELAARAAVTPATLLLACVSVVLSAWSGQHSVVLGMAASRRRTVEEEQLVGFLVDSLPIRVDVRDHRDFTALLAHARQRQVEGLQHHRPAFDAVVEALGVPTQPTGNPLFQVWLNDLSQSAPAPSLPGLSVEEYETPWTPALFDLNFYLRRDVAGDGGYRIDLVRAVDRVASAVADELVDQCLAVLDQVIEDPASQLDALDLRTGRMTDLAVRRHQAPQRSVPGRPVVAQVMETAARQADRVAIAMPDGAAMTYGQLEREVAELADRLASAGCGTGSVVELRTARLPRLAVALLAVWRTGAVAALVDGTLPGGRLDDCRRQLRPSHTLTVPMDSAAPVLSDGVEDPRSLPGASHVLFTSGTTGRPAGVVVPPGPLRTAMDWYLGEFEFTPEDRVPLLAGLGHDPLLRDVLAPLLSGGTLVVPPDDVYSTPARLFDFLLRQRITVLHTTPALLELVLAGGEERHGERLTALRLVVTGGAPLRGGLAGRLRTVTGATLVNAYGATETPQIAAWTRVADEPLPADATLPIGRAVPGTELAVVDAGGRPCGVGQLGELIVCGGQVADGYLDGAERQDRFVSGSDSSRPAAFRTGDLGRLDPSGRIHLAGRSDRQVLIHGLRVTLEEVEAVALRHPGVREAAAALAETVGGETLTLYVTPVPGAAPEPAELRAHLAARLPKAAVPATVRVVERLARDGNHKAAGRPPVGTSAAPGVRTAVIDNVTVARLSEYIKCFIDRDLGPDENFFDAGLNSMAVLRLHARLVEEFDDQIAVTDLFTHTTLRSLAAHLSGAATASSRRTGRRPRPNQTAVRAAESRRSIRSQLYRSHQEHA
ncbi:amino acid adenylation domain-containing protein [Kitasatospora sp. GAS1066B]